MRRHNVVDFLLEILVVIALVTCIKAAVYEVKNSNGVVCMRLDTNFSISVTAKKNGDSIKQTTLNLDKFELNHGFCETSRAILLLNVTSGENTVFRFMFKTIAMGRRVLLTYSFSFYPHDLFNDLPDLTDYTYKGFISGRQYYGSSKTSYKCNRERQIKLFTDPASKDAGGTDKVPYTYGVKLTVSKIQAQAFNMKDGKFSPPTYCWQPRPGPSAGLIVLIVVLVVLPVALATVAVVVVLRRNRAKSGRSSVL